MNSEERKILKSIVSRVERIHEQRDELAADISDIFAEGRGKIDVAIAKAAISYRRKLRKNKEKLEDAEFKLAEYLAALEDTGTEVTNIESRAYARPSEAA